MVPRWKKQSFIVDFNVFVVSDECFVWIKISLARQACNLLSMFKHSFVKKRFIFHIEILDFVVALKKEREAS